MSGEAHYFNPSGTSGEARYLNPLMSPATASGK
jgi:hypothetical protein